MAELQQLPGRLNLTRAPEDDFTVQVTILDNGTPVDITSWEWDAANITVTVIDGPSGRVNLTPTADTVGLRTWRLTRTTPDPRTILAGSDRVTLAAQTTPGTLDVSLQITDGTVAQLSLAPTVEATGELAILSADDLPTPSGGEHVLPADTLVRFVGNIDIGANAIRLSQGTVINSRAGGTIISSATGGVLRATNLPSAVIVRETNIVATDGPCINLSGPAGQQCNLFFVGMFGHSAGTITGFNVQALKACYIQAADGITFAGTTNKVFVHETPFYGITGTAIRLAANLDATVADIVTSFFKFDDGTCIEAETGYTVGDGLLRGSLIDGTATPLSGLGPEDVNWRMTDNLGIRDSTIAGQAALTATATVPIVTAAAFVPVGGTYTLAEVSERFELNGTNELVYTGRFPTLIDFTATFTVDPANNNRVAFRATLNGDTLPESQTIVEQGAGPGSSPRAGAVVALKRITTGDRLGLAAANLDGTADFDVLSCTFAASG